MLWYLIPGKEKKNPILTKNVPSACYVMWFVTQFETEIRKHVSCRVTISYTRPYLHTGYDDILPVCTMPHTEEYGCVPYICHSLSIIFSIGLELWEPLIWIQLLR